MSLINILAPVLQKGKFWTQAWSLVEGCTPVSTGCKNCWLARMNCRNLPNLTPGLIDSKTRHFNGKVIERLDRLDIHLHKRKSQVFAIWSDLFHESVSRSFQERAFSCMSAFPHHYFIIVTKRPAVASEFLSIWHFGLSLKNVIILVTMEDQEQVNKRGPHAVQLAVNGWNVGVLAEPSLWSVNLCLDIWPVLPKWIITGGESGPNARPCHPKWVRSLRDQAQAAGVPFMFKQWGEWAPYAGASPDVDDNPEQTKFLTMEWREDHWENVGYPGWSDFDSIDSENCTGRVGKKKAGRTLDGREWLEVPEI